MRTTVTLDDDVAAIIDGERRRTGEPFRTTINRLLRRAATSGHEGEVGKPVPDLPLLPGGPLLDITDVSEVLSSLDEERRIHRNLL
ncbi:MAG: hypothetical protein JOZ39_03080 [Chloroflexi bacterium]|nr:hypothetical protein [Chloroflexota bacterium]